MSSKLTSPSFKSPPRPDDVAAFLDYHARAKKTKPAPRKLKDIFGQDSSSTAFGKLRRLLEFVTGPNDSLNIRDRSGSAIDEFFEKKDGIILPTRLCEQLATELKHLQSAYESARRNALLAKSGEMVRVAVGSSHTITLRILGPALSGWHSVFGRGSSWVKKNSNPIEVQTDIGNSRFDLIPSLVTGRLDFVIGYGPGPGVSISEELKPLAYVPFPYQVSMVLLCHPFSAVFSRASQTLGHRKDIGIIDCEEYWKAVYEPWYRQKESKRRRLTYNDLKELDVEPRKRKTADLDRLPQVLNRVPISLICELSDPIYIAPSFHQPPVLDEIATRLRAQGRLREMQWYEECVSHVQMGQGMGIVTEIFAQRNNIVAYPFEDQFARTGDQVNANPQTDEASLKRRIGIYYLKERGLTREAIAIAGFIYKYFMQYEARIKSGWPPGLNDSDYLKFCKAFDVSLDWGQYKDDLEALFREMNRRITEEK